MCGLSSTGLCTCGCHAWTVWPNKLHSPPAAPAPLHVPSVCALPHTAAGQQPIPSRRRWRPVSKRLYFYPVFVARAPDSDSECFVVSGSWAQQDRMSVILWSTAVWTIIWKYWKAHWDSVIWLPPLRTHWVWTHSFCFIYIFAFFMVWLFTFFSIISVTSNYKKFKLHIHANTEDWVEFFVCG